MDLLWLTGFTVLACALAWAVYTTGGDFSKLDLSRFDVTGIDFAKLVRLEF